MENIILKGNVVSKCNDIVTGRVRIVNKNTLCKFINGEILVSENTVPDYFNIMKKSKVILTEFGGLLCHAA